MSGLFNFFVLGADRPSLGGVGDWISNEVGTGIGNFIDRLYLGYVVDMVQLDFIDFAIFNVADSYLTVGVLLLILILWKEENGSHH